MTPGAIASIARDHYRTAITTASGHALIADEPPDMGGTGRGPDPFELLLSALSACMVITVRMYADRKGWPLGSARCSLSRRMVEPAARPNSGPALQIDGVLHLEGGLSEEQRQRLADVASRCPVHRALTRGAQVALSLDPATG